MHKVILSISGALLYDAVAGDIGFLGNLIESKLANLYKTVSELPSILRPMQETDPPDCRSLNIASLQIPSYAFQQSRTFSGRKDAGKVTAAAVYYWFSELYNRAPKSPRW